MLKEQLTPGTAINMPLLIQDVTVAATKKGDSYIRAKVGDSSASVTAIQWSVTDAQRELWEPGTVAKILGGVELYQGEPQLKVTGIATVGQEVSVADFYERCPVSGDDLWKQFMEILEDVRGPVSAKVDDTTREYKLAACIVAWMHDAPDVWEQFKLAPAARGMHHAYVGGLLEHSVGTARIVRDLVKLYPNVDAPIAVLGALLHDIGKTWEYELSGGMTDLGKLQGHLFMGAQIADFSLAKYKIYMDAQDRSLLVHIICSHHGLQEWGAIVPPKTPEAWLVHMADMIDVRMWCADHQRPDEGWSWERIKTWGGDVLLKGKEA